jgi:hypothetical protein
MCVCVCIDDVEYIRRETGKKSSIVPYSTPDILAPRNIYSISLSR